MAQQTIADTPAPSLTGTGSATVFPILFAVSICHFLNDVMQSLLSSIYPLLKAEFGLSFWQIGLLTLTFQITASLLQPAIGMYADKRPQPYSLPVGMGSTLIGLLLLAYAHSYPLLLLGAALIGLGSAVFHPEASRVARLASGGRFGLAQSVFQVGGNFGSALGPILAAFIVVPRGQDSVAWFSLAAFTAMLILWRVSVWYAGINRSIAGRPAASRTLPIARGRVVMAITILALLVLSKNAYTASMSSYYTFFVIDRFGLDVQQSQLMLFLFLAAMAVGTVIGGPIGDRIGARTVIWVSILGVLPFTLMLGRVGMIAGLFFGFAFGMGGIAAAVLGVVADARGIDFVFQLCSCLPFLGLLAIFLPRMSELRAARA